MQIGPSSAPVLKIAALQWSIRGASLGAYVNYISIKALGVINRKEARCLKALTYILAYAH